MRILLGMIFAIALASCAPKKAEIVWGEVPVGNWHLMSIRCQETCWAELDLGPKVREVQGIRARYTRLLVKQGSRESSYTRIIVILDYTDSKGMRVTSSFYGFEEENPLPFKEVLEIHIMKEGIVLTRAPISKRRR